MSTIMISTYANALKLTLEQIITDVKKPETLFDKWCKVKKMTDEYEDDLETGGPGLASEKSEGAEIALATAQEGYITRYRARTFALKMIITEEAIEDVKYKEVLQLGKRLMRSMWKTADIDATNMLVRMFNSSYVGGDGQPLGSSSHTLPHGGTFSNQMATPLSPSRTAMIIATSAIKKYPDHNGIIEGYEPRAILCPTEQWAVWKETTGSTKAPEAGEFNRINVINSQNLEVIPIKYWTNTTTNWAVLTDCEYGLNFRWRRRPRTGTWTENNNEVMYHKVSARWARGWSDPRCIYCVNA